MKHTILQSSFAGRSKDFITFKNELAYPYYESKRILFVFDDFCREHFPEKDKLDQELGLAWLERRKTEGDIIFVLGLCPLQSLVELRVLYRDFHDLWAQLKRWDAMTWRPFRADYSVKQLEQRFDFEDEWLKARNRLGPKAFYSALREMLVELDGTHDTDPRQPV